ncbi:MAG: polysaccharide pyruvyl transferase family protein [Anaerolineae bacterium]|nr:polysaccharide pyruvyl transferase family protein [Anaerolineae bacterium]
MHIGAIGWWNYDNQGDLAMLATLRQGLAPHHIVPIDTGFLAHPDTIYRLNRLDYVILGGGTLIPGKPTAPFDTFDCWVDQLECPLGVMGLGVDPFPERYWTPIETMLDRAEFFYVRDRISRTLLHDHAKVIVAPDLTFAYPLPVCEDHIRDVRATPVCGVNLRRSVKFDPTPWMEVFQGLPVKVRGLSLSSLGIFGEDVLLEQLDPGSPGRFDAALYRQLDLMIGTAFHSVLFAVQTGVPVIAIGYAPKVRNFMEDVGLARYLLASDEYNKLPALVHEVLENQSAIRDALYAIRGRLHKEARQNIASVREHIEQNGPRQQRTGPKVTIAIIGMGNVEKDQRTLASCASQTYENIEVLSVSTNPRANTNARLRQALAQSSGEYLTWIESGDWLADDAMDCMISRLEQEPSWDVLYADYYAMSAVNLPIGYHTVSEPDRLFRRDVVGPCFLMRRKLLSTLEQLVEDISMVGYALWLCARPYSVLHSLHAPLFYSARSIKSQGVVAQERQVRRCWRRTRSVWVRFLWGIIDTDLFERLVVQPLARLRDLLRRRYVQRH